MAKTLQIIRDVANAKGVVAEEMLAILLHHLAHGQVGRGLRSGKESEQNVLHEVAGLVSSCNRTDDPPKTLLELLLMQVDLHWSIEANNADVCRKAKHSTAARHEHDAKLLESLILILKTLINESERKGIEDILLIEKAFKDRRDFGKQGGEDSPQ